MSFITYFIENYEYIWEKAIEHMTLAGIAVLLAISIGVPIGFYISKHPKTATHVMRVANIIQTIPSLALFAFAMPLLGIGAKPAIFALFLYALLPIIKNTLLGISNVNPAIKEAARGMGMSRYQIMFKVEVPLAISVIMGGIRIATVTGIGIATIACLIGAGGLGQLIYQGIGMGHDEMIFAGAFSSAMLAIMADALLGLIEKKLTSDGIAK